MSHTLLVVDDDPNCFRMIEALLQGEGYALHYVRDSAAAFDEAVRLAPGIVVTDLMMPKVTGKELCARLKADPRTHEIPVIVLTALDDERELARCLEAGADDFLSKAVSAPELRARVRSMLRIRAHYGLLRESMRLREDFAHIVLHDLGNPLSTIVMEVDDLLAGDPRPDQAAGLQVIRNNARRLREMSHDMLLLAKIEQGKLHLDRRPHDLGAAVAEAIRAVEPQARRRRLDLRFAPQSPSQSAPLLASFDRPIVLRVLDNLLSNAVKFSPPGGAVEVRIGTAEGGLLRVEVEDQGPGIPEALREKVFERFEVGQIRRDVPQMGLGLSFCRTAVEAHGGAIVVGAGRGGRNGARIAFTLESAAAPAAPAPAQSSPSPVPSAIR